MSIQADWPSPSSGSGWPSQLRGGPSPPLRLTVLCLARPRAVTTVQAGARGPVSCQASLKLHDPLYAHGRPEACSSSGPRLPVGCGGEEKGRGGAMPVVERRGLEGIEEQRQRGEANGSTLAPCGLRGQRGGWWLLCVKGGGGRISLRRGQSRCGGGSSTRQGRLQLQ
jgi:hypothetical protein